MKEQQNLSQETEVETQVGVSQEELKLKNQVKKFAEMLGIELTKELALYQIYGDAPREDWENPVPQWVEELPTKQK
jgi:hypothetical protein